MNFYEKYVKLVVSRSKQAKTNIRRNIQGEGLYRGGGNLMKTNCIS